MGHPLCPAATQKNDEGGRANQRGDQAKRDFVRLESGASNEICGKENDGAN
jgi:hypothetical protein